jgi:spore coat polysaccharide biosynthesis predicted glycosyltransferase SpsG
MQNTLIVIPAIKKNAVIPDQLMKKLDGITLIQRAMDTAKKLSTNIFVITDSEEISLIAGRNGIEFYKDKNLIINNINIIGQVQNLIANKQYGSVIIYRANTPLVDSNILKGAYEEHIKDKSYRIVSVKKLNENFLELEGCKLKRVKNNYFKELKSFVIFNDKHAMDKVKPYVVVNEKSIEIENYQDWWICEKILQQKKIIFNVIGNVEIGMGHIYHSLALAHEIVDHEVVFVCDKNYEIAVKEIALTDYRVISTSNVMETIVDFKPDLVINDVLNTDRKDMLNLKNNNIKVVNFEDLGTGSKYADLVFNELYDKPQLQGKNYLWGYEYLALRDEFYYAIPNKNLDNINEVLITFGGADQNNLTLKSLKAIIEKCKSLGIIINIACGSAYKFREILEIYIKNCSYKNIKVAYASGVISKIMEKSQLAISSNGRTVYELADMNIPTIVISHHERESTHTFASLEKGFINLGVINKNISSKINEKFIKLVDDKDYRELLFINIKKYSFRKNKQKVVKKIIELL